MRTVGILLCDRKYYFRGTNWNRLFVNILCDLGSYWLSCRHHFECFTIATFSWLTVTKYLCRKWPRNITMRSKILFSWHKLKSSFCHRVWCYIIEVDDRTWIREIFSVIFSYRTFFGMFSFKNTYIIPVFAFAMLIFIVVWTLNY
jgi:hypothetical protein